MMSSSMGYLLSPPGCASSFDGARMETLAFVFGRELGRAAVSSTSY